MRILLTCIFLFLCVSGYSQVNTRYYYFVRTYCYNTITYHSEYSHYYEIEQDSIIRFQIDKDRTFKTQVIQGDTVALDSFVVKIYPYNYNSYIVKEDSVFIKYGDKKFSLKNGINDTLFKYHNKSDYLIHIGDSIIKLGGKTFDTYCLYHKYFPMAQDGIGGNSFIYIDKLTLLPVLNIGRPGKYPFWIDSSYSVKTELYKITDEPIVFNTVSDITIYEEKFGKWFPWQKAVLQKNLKAGNYTKKEYKCLFKQATKRITFYDFNHRITSQSKLISSYCWRKYGELK